MEMIVNLILLVTSGAATIYCYVLSRRLQRLNDTKNGIGASIASMSQVLDQTQKTLAIARDSSLESIHRLTSLLEEGQRLAPELTHLMDVLDELAAITADDIHNARDHALQQIESSYDKYSKNETRSKPHDWQSERAPKSVAA